MRTLRQLLQGFAWITSRCASVACSVQQRTNCCVYFWWPASLPGVQLQGGILQIVLCDWYVIVENAALQTLRLVRESAWFVKACDKMGLACVKLVLTCGCSWQQRSH